MPTCCILTSNCSLQKGRTVDLDQRRPLTQASFGINIVDISGKFEKSAMSKANAESSQKFGEKDSGPFLLGKGAAPAAECGVV